MEGDPQEVVELERIADWQIRKLGENPGDTASAAAAQLLQKLADGLRGLADSRAYAEYCAICGWLDEYDGREDFADRAHAYRVGIGIEHFPADGEEDLRVLTGFARETFGG